MGAQVEVQVSERAQWVPLPGGRALPTQFWARIDDPSVPHTVMIEVHVSRGSPEVRQLVAHRREDSYPFGSPVTSVSLRKVNVAACLRAALAEASRSRADLSAPRWPGAFTVEGRGDEVFGGPSARRHPADSDRLDVVAEAYRAAKAEGRSVRRAVMEACGVQTSQAARLIRAARDAGKIPPGETTGPAPRDAHILRQRGAEVIATSAPAVRQAEPMQPPRVVNIGDARRTRTARQPVVAAIVTSARGVLAGRRNDATPPWTFIAGESEPGEQPEDTAIREVKEETGLEVRAGRLIGERDHPATGRHMIYLAARPAGRSTKVVVGDEAELAEVRWLSLTEADELLPGMYEPVREHLARELKSTR
jgi:8-oxo-dGTP diphosphatase